MSKFEKNDVKTIVCTALFICLMTAMSVVTMMTAADCVYAAAKKANPLKVSGKTVKLKEYDEDYLEIEEIAPEGKINFFVYLIEDEDYRTNYDEDFDSYYMRFYNVYNEIHVKPKSKILSRNYTNDRDFLRFMLKDLKVTKQEYKFWDSLGLIKNEREMDLDIEDGEEELSKEKVKYKIRRG